MRYVAALGVLAIACAVRAAPATDCPRLATAQRAVRELRYEDAGAEIETLLKRGHLSRRELLAVYALRAEVAAVVGGPVAGQNGFRRLLLLEPEHPPPPRDTPIFQEPFAQAQRWIAQHGPLEAEHRILSAPRVGMATPLQITVAKDAFAMVAGARLWLRAAGETAFTALPTGTLRASVPPIRAGTAVAYYIELVDDADSVLLQIGTSDDPLLLDGPRPPPSVAGPRPSPAPAPIVVAAAAAPPPRHRHPYRIGGGVLAALGLGALGAAVGVDVAGGARLDTLLGSCAPTCAQSDVDALRVSENAAIALYATGGVALASAVVLISVDLAHSRRR
jgi:hypothetical protein